MDKDKRKHRYVEGLGILIIMLALVRCAFPGISTQPVAQVSEAVDSLKADTVITAQTEVPTEEPAPKPDNQVPETKPVPEAKPVPETTKPVATRYLADGQRPHRIKSVPSYLRAFPDSQTVQLQAAQYWGVKPVKDRLDAENRKSELVYVDCSPYYYIDPLHSSIPDLVPRAAILLQDIGQAFFDSLQVKGVPLHRFIVTSVLRSQVDVAKLRQYNPNATEQSCHLYGTTFDICYNRYKTVEDPEGPRRREVRNDTLKFVLSEVLNDMRQNGRCYIKYEVKQGCFHMTVR